MSTFLSAKLFLVIIVIHWGKNFADSLRNLLYIFFECISTMLQVYYFGFTRVHVLFEKAFVVFRLIWPNYLPFFELTVDIYMCIF